jgi:hypothetical protein
MPATSSTATSTRIRWAPKEQLPGLVCCMVRNSDIVLDVGSGIKPQTLIWPKLHICVEVDDEYVRCLRERLAGSPRYLVIQSTWESALRVMPSKSVDTVVALDFIEHLSKEHGCAFIAEAERVARKQVVLFTPLGYFPQTYEDVAAEDWWGMHGGRWQTHRSGWFPADFSEDWEILACRDYHTVDQYGPLAEPIGCMWAIRTFDDAPPELRGRLELRLRRQVLVNRYLPSRCRSALGRIKRLLMTAGK